MLYCMDIDKIVDVTTLLPDEQMIQEGSINNRQLSILCAQRCWRQNCTYFSLKEEEEEEEF